MVKLSFLFKLILFFYLCITNIYGNNHKLNLTKEELIYLKQHPQITIASNTKLVPFIFSQDKKFKGYSIDLLKNLAKKIGVDIKFVKTDSFSKSVKSLENDQIDFLHSSFYTDNLSDKYIISSSFILQQGAFFVRDDNTTVKSLKDLNGKKIAILKQYNKLVMKQKYPKLNIIEFDTNDELLNALVLKKVDVIISTYSSINYMMIQNMIVNIKVGGYFDLKDLGINDELSLISQKKNSQFISIFNKALNLLTSKEKESLEKKWFYNSVDKSLDNEKAFLTKEEFAYLRTKPTIEVHNEMNWPPYNYNKDGKSLGYSIDYMKLIASKLDLKVDFISGYTWDEFMGLIKNNKIDVMLNIIKTKDREKYLNYTTPYIKEMNAVFIQKSSKKYSKLSDLNGKTLSVVKNFYQEELLRTYYPGIKIVTAKDTLESLKLLSFGKVDGTINNLAVIDHLISENGLTNIKPSFEVKDDRFQSYLNIATNKNNKLLRDILEKAKHLVTEEEILSLKDKWLKNNKMELILKLTEEELNYLENKKTIKVHNELDWPPFNYNIEGKPLGYSTSYMHLLASKLDLKVDFISGFTWNEFLDLIKENKIDVMLNTIKTEEREKYLSFTTPYIKELNAVFTIKDGPKYNKLSDFNGKTLSVVKGFYQEELLKKNYPDIKLITTENTLESVKLLSFGKVDGTLNNLAVIDHLISEYGITNIKPSFEVQDKKFRLNLHIVTNKENQILKSILEKAKQFITEDEILSLRYKWLRNSDMQLMLKLSDKELSYLEKKKIIKMCVDPNWLPFEKIDNGEHIGLAADYMKYFSRKIDIPITLVPTSSWSQSLQKAKNKECDILSLAGKTVSRKQYMDFTSAYVSAPIVIATRIGVPFVNNLSEIKDKKIGVVKDYSLHEKFKMKYPDINLVEINSLEDGLKKVQNGKLFGYLGNSIAINHEVQKNFMGTIAISGKFAQKIDLHIATRNDEPLLYKIFEKAVLSLNKTINEPIMNRWININYERYIDYTLIFQILIAGAVLIMIFVYRQYVIKKINSKLQIRIDQELKKSRDKDRLLFQQSKLAAMGEMIENIAHQWRQPLSQVNSAVLIIDDEVNELKIKNKIIDEKLNEIEFMTKYMSNTINDFKSFYEQDKQIGLFSLNKSILSAFSIVRASFKYNKIEFVLEVDSSVHVNGYGNEFEQSILVILNNAKDVLVSNKISNPMIKINLETTDDLYILSICNNGGVIKDEQINKIFEPYFTTKHKTQGTGLGLYLSKMILEESMDTKFYVKNIEYGVCFCIEFKKEKSDERDK